MSPFEQRCLRRSDDAPSEDERRNGDDEENEEADPRQRSEIAGQTAEAEHGGYNRNQKKRNGPVEHRRAFRFARMAATGVPPAGIAVRPRHRARLESSNRRAMTAVQRPHMVRTVRALAML